MKGWGLEALGWGSLGWTDCFSISHLTKAPALFKFNLLFALARTKHISIRPLLGTVVAVSRRRRKSCMGKIIFLHFFAYHVYASIGKKCVPVKQVKHLSKYDTNHSPVKMRLFPVPLTNSPSSLKKA